MKKQILSIKNDLFLSSVVLGVMLLSLTTRLINLNYNAPFNDEAVYVIVGLMGIFERDWWTYNASVWIPGVQYLYPSLTAIAYNFGGITASRFVNVLLGVFLVETIFLLTSTIHYQISKKDVKSESTLNASTILAGLIAAIIISSSEISLYVSRLATYDMPSFTFLFFSLLLLIHFKPLTSGRRYFYAALFLALSFLTKIITGIYLPLIIVYFYLYAAKIGKSDLEFYKKYFLVPLAVILILFLVISFNSLSIYYSSQQQLSKGELQKISEMIWDNSKYIWGFWLLGTVGLLLKKQFYTWVTLTLSALWIICFHLVTSRTLSMDKHLLLMIGFLAIVSGLGIGNILNFIKPKAFKIPATVLVLIVLAGYSFFSYQKLDKFNTAWQNTYQVENALYPMVKSGDKILTESGSTIILSTYYKNFPPNTSTFDWLEYRHKTGDEAYKMAVRDGYFDLIQLEDTSHFKSEHNAYLSELVKKNMEMNYQLVFDQEGFLIYKRAF